MPSVTKHICVFYKARMQIYLSECLGLWMLASVNLSFKPSIFPNMQA